MKDIENLPKIRIRGQIAPKDSFVAMMGAEVFSASDLLKFLDDNKNEGEIVVEISSDGGFRAEGVEIYNILKTCGKEVYTVAFKANSIATVIMLGGSKGKRLIVENAPFVVHFARIDPMNLPMDPLTAEDLRELAEETERADKQIVDLYCAELGEEKRTELLALMSDEKDLGAKGAIRLGFANGYYKKKKKEIAVEDFKGVVIDNYLAKLIENNMADQKQTEKLTKIESLIENLTKLFTSKKDIVKNEVMTLKAGGSIDVTPVDETDPTNLVGAAVKKVGDDGVATSDPADDGEYELENGQILVVAGGVVTEQRESGTEAKAKELETENATLKEKVAALSTEIENLKKSNEEMLKNEKLEMQKKLDVISNEFKDYKRLVTGERKKDDEHEPPKKDLSKMSVSERLFHMRHVEKSI